MSRIIGDVHDSIIKDAQELYLYYPREKEFKLVNRKNFPINNCPICPIKFNKTHEIGEACSFKARDWSGFKTHIQRAERLTGELIAYPSNSILPDTKIFDKPRAYAYIQSFIRTEPTDQKKRFYIFDLEKKKFIPTSFSLIRSCYIKNNLCNYCRCNRTVISRINMINHIGMLESRYHCFLLLESMEDNDEKNRERLVKLLNDYENRSIGRLKSKSKPTMITRQSNRPVLQNTNQSINSTYLTASTPTSTLTRNIISTQQLLRELMDESDQSVENMDIRSRYDNYVPTARSKTNIKQSNHHNDVNNMNGLNSNLNSNSNFNSNSNQRVRDDDCITLLNQIKNLSDKYSKDINLYVKRLEQLEINRKDLISSLIEEQLDLNLIEKKKNYNNREYNLKFGKKIFLARDDLNLLMNKYGLSDFEIECADICLNLTMKDYTPRFDGIYSHLENNDNKRSHSTSRLNSTSDPFNHQTNKNQLNHSQNKDQFHRRSQSLGRSTEITNDSNADSMSDEENSEFHSGSTTISQNTSNESIDQNINDETDQSLSTSKPSSPIQSSDQNHNERDRSLNRSKVCSPIQSSDQNHNERGRSLNRSKVCSPIQLTDQNNNENVRSKQGFTDSCVYPNAPLNQNRFKDSMFLGLDSPLRKYRIPKKSVVQLNYQVDSTYYRQERSSIFQQTRREISDSNEDLNKRRKIN